jgi:hypothetical protein
MTPAARHSACSRISPALKPLGLGAAGALPMTWAPATDAAGVRCSIRACCGCTGGALQQRAGSSRRRSGVGSSLLLRGCGA